MLFVETTTHCPTSMLIEDHQDLVAIAESLANGSYGDIMDVVEKINTVIECLAQAIDEYSDPVVFEGRVAWKPSVATPIAMSIDNGVIVRDDGQDVLCAAKKPISSCSCNGVWQCDAGCMKEHGCDPENGKTCLLGGFVYQRDPGKEEEALVDAVVQQETEY